MSSGIGKRLLLALLLLACLGAAAREAPRSKAARAAFMRSHPCPANGARRGPCPGYIVDHIIALECGGADSPANMQWQTVRRARAKDRIEARCKK